LSNCPARSGTASSAKQPSDASIDSGGWPCPRTRLVKSRAGQTTSWSNRRAVAGRQRASNATAWIARKSGNFSSEPAAPRICAQNAPFVKPLAPSEESDLCLMSHPPGS